MNDALIALVRDQKITREEALKQSSDKAGLESGLR